jgi:hypothetical protein
MKEKSLRLVDTALNIQLLGLILSSWQENKWVIRAVKTTNAIMTGVNVGDEIKVNEGIIAMSRPKLQTNC